MNRRGFSLPELIAVMAIIGILLGLGAPPFMAMLRRSTLEEKAQRFQETLKLAQNEAQKRGSTEFGNLSTASGRVISARKQSVYVAIYPAANRYRVLAWSDTNQDSLKTDNEFTIIEEISIGDRASFTLPASINRVACNNTPEVPGDSIVNFTASSCPATATSMFPEGTRCAKFNGKGFCESMFNAAVYISNSGGETFAVTMNPVGLTDVCRWEGNRWLKIR